MRFHDLLTVSLNGDGEGGHRPAAVTPFVMSRGAARGMHGHYSPGSKEAAVSAGEACGKSVVRATNGAPGAGTMGGEPSARARGEP